ncbi:neural cell adhesion molecule 1-like [Notothenia coriiceps]|uniref:Neural cell adhesion molecule 1-like n=1 Tax=Notothenia coriiceps TaxID=8208 RepID=A0A6I9PWN6_9TELE|nr:PREDICTED: neural cell adhesion molecule 1-like [Notothenia coriiceps]
MAEETKAFPSHCSYFSSHCLCFCFYCFSHHLFCNPLDFSEYSFTISSETPPHIAATSLALSEYAEGEPSAPKLEVKVLERGNSLKVNWIKQDDGGSPIKHYLVRYKAKHVSEWKPEIRMPQNSEYTTLSGLDWNTEYEVYVVAENQQGKSEPGVVSFRTASDPTTIPATLGCRCVSCSLAALLLSMLALLCLS